MDGMIAEKTYDEILLMKKWNRCYWYKKILPEEKEEAMKVVDIAGRNKNRIYMTNRVVSEETRSKIRGENNPAKRPEIRAKISAAWTSEKRAKMSAVMTDRVLSEETRSKISVGNKGKNMGKDHWNWKGGSSFLPYCYLFNKGKREEVRNRWGRVCVLTDLMRSTLGSDAGLNDFEGHEIFNVRRLAVHHVEGDKMAGCNGSELALVPLQGSYNNKKFDNLKLEEHPFYITLFLFKDIERKHREEMLRIQV